MRSLFWKLFWTLTGLVTACLIYGFLIEPKLLFTRYVSIDTDVESTPDIRIVLLSDIHIGGLHVSAARVEKIATKINALKPDMVLIAGDFINGHEPRGEQSETFNNEVDRGIAALRALEAPLGVFASIGNHDRWYDAEHVELALGGTGITVLDNDVANLAQGFCIVGLADAQTAHEDPTVFERCEGDKAVIAMMHSPDSLLDMRGDIALIVTGHTHGGQINIPLIGRRVTATDLGSDYAYGEKQFGRYNVFITAGIGTSILPARFRAPPEIVVIELR